MIFQNCLKFHSPITARDREITSDNFEIQPQIMLLPMQIPYKFPIYECTSAFFVHVLGKCCLVSQISSQRSRLYVCLNYGVEWGVGKAAKVLTNDRVTSTVEDLYEEFYFNIQHREANSFTDL